MLTGDVDRILMDISARFKCLTVVKFVHFNVRHNFLSSCLSVVCVILDRARSGTSLCFCSPINIAIVLPLKSDYVYW